MRLAPAVLLVLPLSGCIAFDPWGEQGGTSTAPSVAWRSGAAPAALAPPPGLPAERRGRAQTLADCLAVALERRPETRSAWLVARAAAARVGEEKAAFLPAIEAFASGSRADAPADRDAGASPRDEFRAGLALKWVLYDGGRRYGRIDAASAELRAANSRHHAALLDAAVEVEIAFHRRIAADALVQVAEEAYKQRDAHLELARARLRAGAAAKFDVLKAETERADADLARVRARSEARLAAGRLARAMGLPATEAFEIEAPAEESPRLEQPAIEGLIADALRERPELRAARARIEAREADARALRADWLPTVSATADAGWSGSAFFPRRGDTFFGVGVTIPLFDGFGREYRAARAKADVEAAVASREVAARDVELEVWTSWSRLREGAEAVEAAGALAAAAEESARAAEGRYRTGAGSIIELVDSLTERTQARARRVTALLEWRTARSALARALGRSPEGGAR